MPLRAWAAFLTFIVAMLALDSTPAVLAASGGRVPPRFKVDADVPDGVTSCLSVSVSLRVFFALCD